MHLTGFYMAKLTRNNSISLVVTMHGTAGMLLFKTYIELRYSRCCNCSPSCQQNINHGKHHNIKLNPRENYWPENFQKLSGQIFPSTTFHTESLIVSNLKISSSASSVQPECYYLNSLLTIATLGNVRESNNINISSGNVSPRI